MVQSAPTRRPVRPTTPADLWRLADQARANGVRLLSEGLSGERFATSAIDPGTVYRLTAYSCTCTCKGFCHTGRCQHHSLLLAELGWLPDTDPVVIDVVILDEQPAPCRACRGEGSVRAYIGGGLSDWIMAPCGCRSVAPAA